MSSHHVIRIRHDLPMDRSALLDLLRLAMVETYPDLAELPHSEFNERVESEFAHYFEQPEKIIRIADCAGEVAGCLWTMGSFHPVTGLADLFVVNLATFPRFRGRGVAKLLLNEAVSEARRSGLQRIRLFVNPQNRAAYALYERMGFEPQTHEMRLILKQ